MGRKFRRTGGFCFFPVNKEEKKKEETVDISPGKTIQERKIKIHDYKTKA